MEETEQPQQVATTLVDLKLSNRRNHDCQNGKMERSACCKDNCKQAADLFDAWVKNDRKGEQPVAVACKDLEMAEGWVVKVKLQATEPPHSPQSTTHMLHGLRKTEGPWMM